MKTCVGEVDDSWMSIIGTQTSILMLETIKAICNIGNDSQVLDAFKHVSLDNLKTVVIVDNKWGPYANPFEYDKNIPPEAVERVAKLLGKYPDPSKWAGQGILAITFPVYCPKEFDRNKFRTVWEGWVRHVLKCLSARKKTHTYAFLLLGRQSQRLDKSISLVMPTVKGCDPSSWEYTQECYFTLLNKTAKLKLCW